MLAGEISFPRFVGVAPGTTTVAFQGFGQVEAAKVPAVDEFPLLNPPQGFPTQAVWQPDPNIDNVKITLPPNQWVTGPVEMRISVPTAQRAFGPVPNDDELSRQTTPYQIVRKGWIDTNEGPIFSLQGDGLGEMTTAEKWAIAASILSAIALGTTTILAIARYRRDTRRSR